MAMKLLGWQEDVGGKHFILKDLDGKKIVCTNNTNNRPFDRASADALCQKILRMQWQLNLENIIIGETGIVLDGQHRLIALVLAKQHWEKSPGTWIGWQEEPHIVTSIAYGGNESDEVVNTINTGRERSLVDVLFRCDMLQKLKGDRKQNAKVVDWALRTVWRRTGTGEEAFSKEFSRLYRTHEESLDFLERHPSILKCAKHVIEEDSDKKIRRYLQPGGAAGLMYLMASSKTKCEDNGNGYFEVSSPSEKLLDMSRWNKAEEFFVELASGKKLKAVAEALGPDYYEDVEPSFNEKFGVLVKAWNLFCRNKAVKVEEIVLEYETDGEGVSHLAETPTVGGVDIGDSKLAVTVDEEELGEAVPEADL